MYSKTRAFVLGGAMTLGLAMGMTCHSDAKAAVQYTPIDFSEHHNCPLNSAFQSSIAGEVKLGGVPFDIPVSGNAQWQAVGAASHGVPGIQTIDIAINRFGVDSVHTLISTYWGEAVPGRLQLEFFGADGAYYLKDMIGDSDIRDWTEYPGWTTTINGTTTQNVVTLPNYYQGTYDAFVDMQTIDLPADFDDEVLTTMRLIDNREVFHHSGVLMGVTVGSIPEPTSVIVWSLLGLIACGWTFRRKMKA